MRTENIIDLSLGLNHQSWAVLHALAYMGEESFGIEHGDDGFEPYVGSDVKTAPWYNGRERGFCIEFRDSLSLMTPSLFVVFAENRNSDSIVVYHIEKGRGLNPMTDADGVGEKHEDEFWGSATYFNVLRVDQVVKHIAELARKYYIKRRTERAAKKAPKKS